mgnify:FL=1
MPYPQEIRSGFCPNKRKFLPPDGPLTGRSVVVSEPPSVSFEPLVPLVPATPPSAPANPNAPCISQLFNAHRGRRVRLTVVIGAAGEPAEKDGVLVFSSPGHIAIQEENGRNLMVFDMGVVKTVNIYDAF